MNPNMNREIGSEYSMTRELPAKGEAFSGKGLFPAATDISYLRSGRDAIGLVLDNMEPQNKTALLPAYSCKSMSLPFQKHGYRIRYYRLKEPCLPDLDDIERGIEKEPGVFLYMDWFGMDVNRDAVALVRSLSDKTALLEDRTHNIFSKNAGNKPETDYAVASLRKWYGTPDGAIALSFHNRFANKPLSMETPFTKLREEALLLKEEYLENPIKDKKECFRCKFLVAEGLLEKDTRIVTMSTNSSDILNKLDLIELREKRLQNYSLLEESLIHHPLIKPMCNVLAKNDCPFSYPILIDGDRDYVQRKLAETGIYCPVLWPVPYDARIACPVSARISDCMLSIPCDQRYGEEDMRYIVHSLRRIFSS